MTIAVAKAVKRFMVTSLETWVTGLGCFEYTPRQDFCLYLLGGIRGLITTTALM
jgi:hypothetical protein